jgi:hypothetical protein
VLEENIWTQRDELVGGWRKLHNEELYNLYSSPNVIRWRMRWTGNVASIREKRKAYTV